MKIKNLAFYGVMAAILGSVGTARADDSTIIASKGYVDAYAQKQADRYQGTWSGASSAQKASTDLYPSMHTLEDAVGNSVNGLDYTQTDTGVVKTVSQTDGLIAVTAGTVDTDEITDGAVTYAKVNSAAKQEAQDLSAAGATLTRWDADTASDAAFPTVKAVAQQISASNPESVNSNALAQAAANDSKLTQVAAIKDMVTTSGETAGVRNNNLNAVDFASDQKVPSEKAVAEELALKYDTANTTPVVDSTDGATSFETISANNSVGVNLGNLDALKENKSNKKNATSAAEWNTLTAAATKSTDYPTVQAVENALSTVTGDYEQNNVVTSANPNKATKVTAVQKGTFYMNGADIANRTANADISAVNSYVNTALADGGPGMKWGVEGLTGTNADKMDDYIPTVAAVEARFKAQDKHNNDTYLEGNDITASNVHSIVTYDSDGLVTGGINLNETLNNINVANGGSANDNACSAANPCVLSYIGGNTYKWTQMATEGLSAVADQASGS